jgi:peptide/nickel transport system substrate-binding protein
MTYASAFRFPTRERSRRRRRWLALASACALACGGCSAAATTTTAANQQGPAVFKIGATFLPTFIDPAKGIDAVFTFAEALTRVNSRGQPVPVLLAKLPQQQSSTRWLLTLRPGITFQDGGQLDAKSLVASMQREMRLSAAARADLPGAVFSVAGPLTVTVKTHGLVRLLPYDLADPAFDVYDVSAITGASNGDCAWAGRKAFTAAYEIATCTANSMTLVPYRGYWQGKPSLKEIQITLVSDPLAKVDGIESGQLDMADSANESAIRDAIQGRSNIELNLSPVPLNLTRLYLNVTKPPMDDGVVRKAISQSLNYAQLGTVFTNQVGEPGKGILPPGYPGAVANQKYDPADAAQLLSADGWRIQNGVRVKGGTSLSLTMLIYNERPALKQLAVAMQSELAAVGIKLSIQTQPFSYSMYNTTPWNLALYNDYSVGPDGVPDSYMSTYLGSKGSENFGHIHDPALDSMLAAIVAAPNQATRDRLLAQIQNYVVVSKAYQSVVLYTKDGALVTSQWKCYVPDADSYQFAEWNWNIKSCS